MRQEIIDIVGGVVKELFGLDIAVVLERPEEQFGDFSTNIAMQLSKELGKNPRDIAQSVVQKLKQNELFETVAVAGPGFINLTVIDGVLISSIDTNPYPYMKGLKVLVEYSDPNPFKPLHAGHLYTTLVGDVLARLVEQAGAETIRLNYGGDVGRHVAITMWNIIREIGGEDVDKVKSIPEADLASWMGKMYSEGTAAFEDDETVKSEIAALNKKVYQLHADNDHESQFAQIYWYLRDKSYEFFTQLYESLQVKAFDDYIPESSVTELGIKTVEEQLEKGVFEHSNGAVVFAGEKHGLHTRVFINSEGLPTYETKDIGLSLTKWQRYHFDESIIITAHEQAQYMQVVIKAIEQFAPEPAERTRHLTHGVVKLTGGVKMSSRRGNILSASDILDAARQAGLESGQATNEEVVLASVKYAFLKNRIGGDIIYNPEESIATEGNSGPYLQYAYARASSILRKTETPSRKLDKDQKIEKSERSLIRKLTEYPDVIDIATQELAPHHICTYLYELAQSFNRFYENVTVIGSENEDFRVGLVSKYAETLKKGLTLLGIHAPEQM